jgi:hypothetical protein
VVKLGIRDKYGSLGKFKAVFIVSAPDGSQHEASVSVEQDKWGYVLFPDDFETWAKPGPYSWKCLVDSRQVLSGRFEFMTISTFADQARVYRLER